MIDTTKSFGILPLSVMADRNLSFGAKTLYAALMYHARNENQLCFPVNDTLADELGTSIRTVQRLLSELMDTGYIKYPRHQKPGGYIRHITFLTNQGATNMSL